MYTPISILPDTNVKTEVSIDTSHGAYVLRINVAHYAGKGEQYAGTTAINFQFDRDSKEAFTRLLEQLEHAIHVARQENEI